MRAIVRFVALPAIAIALSLSLIAWVLWPRGVR